MEYVHTVPFTWFIILYTEEAQSNVIFIADSITFHGANLVLIDRIINQNSKPEI